MTNRRVNIAVRTRYRCLGREIVFARFDTTSCRKCNLSGLLSCLPHRYRLFHKQSPLLPPRRRITQSEASAILGCHDRTRIGLNLKPLSPSVNPNLGLRKRDSSSKHVVCIGIFAGCARRIPASLMKVILRAVGVIWSLMR